MAKLNRGEGVKSTSPGGDVLEFSAPISGVKDLVALGPYPTVGEVEGMPARVLIFTGTSGETITITTANGEQRTLSVDLWDKVPIVCGVRSIDAADSSIIAGCVW